MWSWYYDYGERTVDILGEEHKRDSVSDMSTFSPKAVKTSTWPQHYMIPRRFDTFPLQFRPTTLKTKPNFKVSLLQDSIWSQWISNRFLWFLLINLLHQRLMLLIRIVLNE